MLVCIRGWSLVSLLLTFVLCIVSPPIFCVVVFCLSQKYPDFEDDLEEIFIAFADIAGATVQEEDMGRILG